jgi:hypothetical protein
MAKQQRLSLVFFLGIAITVIILLASGLSALDFQAPNSLNLIELLLQNLRPPRFESGSGSVGSGPPMKLLQPIFWGLLLFSLIYAFVSPRFRRTLLRTLLTIILLAILLSTLTERLELERTGEESVDTGGAALEPGNASLPDPPSFVTDPPTWFIVIVNIVLALLLLGVIWLFWRLLRPKPSPQTLLVQQAEQALIDLEAGGDVKDVVLRCYAGMSQVLRESRNIKRRRAMTPREFESHLAELGLRDEHIERLTHLFEGVRYGARPTTRRTELQAMDCLRAIVRAYGEAG